MVCLYVYTPSMRKHTKRKEEEPVQKKKRFKTTLNLPEDLWKATRIKAIEMNMDAQDIVAEALAHLAHAVGALQQRQRQRHLGFKPHLFLELTPGQQVEYLVRPADLDIGLDFDRIVSLHDRVEKFVQTDRLLALVALHEIVPRQQARHREPGGQGQDPGEIKRLEPFSVVTDFETRRVVIENLERLVRVRLGVGRHLLRRQRRPGRRPAGRVADPGREIADDQDGFVAQILKLPHLDGITISGGEPMTQAEALFRLVERIRYINDLSVIIFSGYRYENLVDAPPGPFVHKLLENIDVLIDGLYIERLNNGKGLRGSTNQRFIHLTDRLKDYDFENLPRKVEVHLSDGEAFLVGVPDSKVLDAFQRGLDKARSRQIYGG